jgi:2-polyprenyl-6-methoxyphenol hydroxylase-like FAD-dependent oxidoreductase
MLLRLARNANVEIRFGCDVKSVDAYTPSVTLASGEVIRGDMVVGADGDQSYIRDVVLDYHEPGIPKGTAVYV